MVARARAKSTTAAGRPTDSVGRMLPVWKNELPELDLETEGIVERIQKINRYIGRQLDDTLKEFGLDMGEWSVLMALRRTGTPYRLSAGVLARHVGLSAAAMTNRLNRLEGRRLVRRTPDASDRSSRRIPSTRTAAWFDTAESRRLRSSRCREQ